MLGVREEGVTREKLRTRRSLISPFLESWRLRLTRTRYVVEVTSDVCVEGEEQGRPWEWGRGRKGRRRVVCI